MVSLLYYLYYCRPILKTIGHHTCKKDGGRVYVLSNAPFLSVVDPSGKKPFLGEGFYFWDFDIDQAKSWGQTHYKNNFFVFQANLNIDDEILLDLAGNRQQMVYFAQLIERFKRNHINVEQWKIGAFIEFLKVFRKKDYTIFPFEAVRAEDYLAAGKSSVKKYFFNEKNHYTNLNARFVICFFILNDIPSQDKSIAFESN